MHCTDSVFIWTLYLVCAIKPVVGCSDWLFDGGEMGHGCGLLHQKLSMVFAGAPATRRLCTPLIDLSHVGSLHFRFSFGNFVIVWSMQRNTVRQRDRLTACLTNHSVTNSGVFRGGMVRCPPFGPTMKIFYRQLYMKRCVFCHCSARIAKFNNVWWSFVFPNFRKIGEFAVSIKHSEAKSVSASGGLRRLTPRPGLCPWAPLGAPPPDPRYRLVLGALAMAPLC